MSTTYCEDCFPGAGDHEVLTIVPVTPCRCCGRFDQRGTGGVTCHLYRGDPFPDANPVAERIEQLACQAWGVEKHFFGTPQLHRFAALVAEHCAQQCDQQMNGVEQPSDCAAAIRAAFPTPKAG